MKKFITLTLCVFMAVAALWSQESFKEKLWPVQTAEQRKENGGLLSFAFTPVDFYHNLHSGYERIGGWDLGVGLRVGNYKDRVQFIATLQPGLWEGRAYNEHHAYTNEFWKFHLPLVARVNVNVVKPVYVFGAYQYNIVHIADDGEDIEGRQAWRVGAGIAWRQVDWSFYFCQNVGYPAKPHIKDYNPMHQHFIGTSLTFYWRIK